MDNLNNVGQPPLGKVAGILHEIPRFNGKLKSISADFDPDSSDYKKSLAIIGFFVASLFICFLMAVILGFLFVRYGNPQDSMGLTSKKIVLNVLAVVGLVVTVIPLLYEIFLHEEILRIMDNYEPEPILKYVSESVDSILYDTGSDEINRLQVDAQRMAPEKGAEYWYWGHSYVRRATNSAHEVYSRFKRLKDMIPKEWSPSYNKELIEMEFDRHFFCVIGWSILILAAVIFLIGIAVGSGRAIILLVVFGGLDFVLTLGFAIAITFGVAVATADACYAPVQAARRILPQSMIDKFQLIHARCYHWKYVKLPAYVKLTYEFYYERKALDYVKDQMTKLRTNFQYWERENGTRVSILLEHYATDAIRAFNLIEPSRHYLLPECRSPDQIMAQSIRRACLGLPNFILYQVLACIIACFIYAFIVFVYISVLRWSISSLIIRVKPKKSTKKNKEKKKSKKGKHSKKRKTKKTKGKRGKRDKKGKKGKGITKKKKAQAKKTTTKGQGVKKKKRNEKKKNEETKNIGKKWNELATITSNPKSKKGKKGKKSKPVEVRNMTEKKKLTNKKLDSQKNITASDAKSKKDSKKQKRGKIFFGKSSKKVDSKKQLKSTDKKRFKKLFKETTSTESDTKKSKPTIDKSDTSTERGFGIRKKQKTINPLSEKSSNKTTDALGKKSDKKIRSKKSPRDKKEIRGIISKTSSKTKTKKGTAVKTPKKQKMDGQDTKTSSEKSFDALGKKSDIKKGHGKISKTKLKTKTEKATALQTPTENQMIKLHAKKSFNKSVDAVRESIGKILKSKSKTKTEEGSDLKTLTEQRRDMPHTKKSSKKSTESFSEKSDTKLINKKSPKDVRESHGKISKTTSKPMTEKGTTVKTPTEQETDWLYAEEPTKKSINALSEKSDTILINKKSPKDVRESHGKISKTTSKPMTEKGTTVKTPTEQETDWPYAEEPTKKSIDALSEKSDTILINKKSPKDVRERYGKISKTISKPMTEKRTTVDTPTKQSEIIESEKTFKDTVESQKGTIGKYSKKTTLDLKSRKKDAEKNSEKPTIKAKSEKTSKDTIEPIKSKEPMETKSQMHSGEIQSEKDQAIEREYVSKDTVKTPHFEKYSKESRDATFLKHTKEYGSEQFSKITHTEPEKPSQKKSIISNYSEKYLINTIKRPTKEPKQTNKESNKQINDIDEGPDKKSIYRESKKEDQFFEQTHSKKSLIDGKSTFGKKPNIKESKKSVTISEKNLESATKNKKIQPKILSDKSANDKYETADKAYLSNEYTESSQSEDFVIKAQDVSDEEVINVISGQSSQKTQEKPFPTPEGAKSKIELDKLLDIMPEKNYADRESKKQVHSFELPHSKKSSIDAVSTLDKKPMIEESKTSTPISEKNIVSETKKTHSNISSDKYHTEDDEPDDKSYLFNDFIQTARPDSTITKLEDASDKKGKKSLNKKKPSKTIDTKQKSEIALDKALKEKHKDKKNDLSSRESGKYTEPVQSLQQKEDDRGKKEKRSFFNILFGKKSKSFVQIPAKESKQTKPKIKLDENVQDIETVPENEYFNRKSKALDQSVEPTHSEISLITDAGATSKNESIFIKSVISHEKKTEHSEMTDEKESSIKIKEKKSASEQSFAQTEQGSEKPSSKIKKPIEKERMAVSSKRDQDSESVELLQVTDTEPKTNVLVPVTLESPSKKKFKSSSTKSVTKIKKCFLFGKQKSDKNIKKHKKICKDIEENEVDNRKIKSFYKNDIIVSPKNVKDQNFERNVQKSETETFNIESRKPKTCPEKCSSAISTFGKKPIAKISVKSVTFSDNIKYSEYDATTSEKETNIRQSDEIYELDKSLIETKQELEKSNSRFQKPFETFFMMENLKISEAESEKSSSESIEIFQTSDTKSETNISTPKTILETPLDKIKKPTSTKAKTKRNKCFWFPKQKSDKKIEKNVFKNDKDKKKDARKSKIETPYETNMSSSLLESELVSEKSAKSLIIEEELETKKEREELETKREQDPPKFKTKVSSEIYASKSKNDDNEKSFKIVEGNITTSKPKKLAKPIKKPIRRESKKILAKHDCLNKSSIQDQPTKYYSKKKISKEKRKDLPKHDCLSKSLNEKEPTKYASKKQIRRRKEIKRDVPKHDCLSKSPNLNTTTKSKKTVKSKRKKNKKAQSKQTTQNKHSKDSEVTTDETITDETTEDETETDKESTDEISVDEMISDEITENKMRADEVTEDNLTADKMIEDKMTAKEMIEDKMTLSKITEDKMTADKISEVEITEKKLRADEIIINKITTDTKTDENISNEIEEDENLNFDGKDSSDVSLSNDSEMTKSIEEEHTEDTLFEENISEKQEEETEDTLFEETISEELEILAESQIPIVATDRPRIICYPPCTPCKYLGKEIKPKYQKEPLRKSIKKPYPHQPLTNLKSVESSFCDPHEAMKEHSLNPSTSKISRYSNSENTSSERSRWSMAESRLISSENERLDDKTRGISRFEGISIEEIQSRYRKAPFKKQSNLYLRDYSQFDDRIASDHPGLMEGPSRFDQSYLEEPIRNKKFRLGGQRPSERSANARRSRRGNMFSGLQLRFDESSMRTKSRYEDDILGDSFNIDNRSKEKKIERLTTRSRNYNSPINVQPQYDKYLGRWTKSKGPHPRYDNVAAKGRSGKKNSMGGRSTVSKGKRSKYADSAERGRFVSKFSMGRRSKVSKELRPRYDNGAAKGISASKFSMGGRSPVSKGQRSRYSDSAERGRSASKFSMGGRSTVSTGTRPRYDGSAAGTRSASKLSMGGRSTVSKGLRPRYDNGAVKGRSASKLSVGGRTTVSKGQRSRYNDSAERGRSASKFSMGGRSTVSKGQYSQYDNLATKGRSASKFSMGGRSTVSTGPRPRYDGSAAGTRALSKLSMGGRSMVSTGARHRYDNLAAKGKSVSKLSMGGRSTVSKGQRSKYDGSARRGGFVSKLTMRDGSKIFNGPHGRYDGTAARRRSASRFSIGGRTKLFESSRSKDDDSAARRRSARKFSKGRRWTASKGRSRYDDLPAKRRSVSKLSMGGRSTVPKGQHSIYDDSARRGGFASKLSMRDGSKIFIGPHGRYYGSAARRRSASRFSMGGRSKLFKRPRSRYDDSAARGSSASKFKMGGRSTIPKKHHSRYDNSAEKGRSASKFSMGRRSKVPKRLHSRYDDSGVRGRPARILPIRMRSKAFKLPRSSYEDSAASSVRRLSKVTKRPHSRYSDSASRGRSSSKLSMRDRSKVLKRPRSKYDDSYKRGRSAGKSSMGWRSKVSKVPQSKSDDLAVRRLSLRGKSKVSKGQLSKDDNSTARGRSASRLSMRERSKLHRGQRSRYDDLATGVQSAKRFPMAAQSRISSRPRSRYGNSAKIGRSKTGYSTRERSTISKKPSSRYSALAIAGKSASRLSKKSSLGPRSRDKKRSRDGFTVRQKKFSQFSPQGMSKLKERAVGPRTRYNKSLGRRPRSGKLYTRGNLKSGPMSQTRSRLYETRSGMHSRYDMLPPRERQGVGNRKKLRLDQRSRRSRSRNGKLPQGRPHSAAGLYKRKKLGRQKMKSSSSTSRRMGTAGRSHSSVKLNSSTKPGLIKRGKIPRGLQRGPRKLARSGTGKLKYSDGYSKNVSAKRKQGQRIDRRPKPSTKSQRRMPVMAVKGSKSLRQGKSGVSGKQAMRTGKGKSSGKSYRHASMRKGDQNNKGRGKSTNIKSKRIIYKSSKPRPKKAQKSSSKNKDKSEKSKLKNKHAQKISKKTQEERRNEAKRQEIVKMKQEEENKQTEQKETERREMEKIEELKQKADNDIPSPTRLEKGELPCNKYKCDSTLPKCTCSCLTLKKPEPRPKKWKLLTMKLSKTSSTMLAKLRKKKK